MEITTRSVSRATPLVIINQGGIFASYCCLVENSAQRAALIRKASRAPKQGLREKPPRVVFHAWFRAGGLWLARGSRSAWLVKLRIQRRWGQPVLRKKVLISQVDRFIIGPTRRVDIDYLHVFSDRASTSSIFA